MTLFNILFTSLTPLAIGIFDRDVTREQCIKYPGMYKQGAWRVCVMEGGEGAGLMRTPHSLSVGALLP